MSSLISSLFLKVNAISPLLRIPFLQIIKLLQVLLHYWYIQWDNQSLLDQEYHCGLNKWINIYLLIPVFSTFKIFLIQATTSWDDGFEGLSRLITPYCLCLSIGLFVGDQPHGRGVKWLDLTFSESKFYNFNKFVILWAKEAILMSQ